MAQSAEERRAYKKSYNARHRQKLTQQAYAWNARNKEKRIASDKKYYETHREAILQQKKEYHQRTRANHLARMATYDNAHKEEKICYNRTYNQENKDAIRQQKRDYRAAKPEVGQAAGLRRRARIAHAPINDLTPAQAQAVVNAANGVCVYCVYYNPGCKACKRRTHKLSIDHITALANNGPNTLHNLVACCQSCNAKKKLNPPPIPVQPLLL